MGGVSLSLFTDAGLFILMAGQLPDKSLAFQKQLQQAHSPDLELEKMEVPNGEKNEKSEKSESLIRICSCLIYIIYW